MKRKLELHHSVSLMSEFRNVWSRWHFRLLYKYRDSITLVEIVNAEQKLIHYNIIGSKTFSACKTTLYTCIICCIHTSFRKRSIHLKLHPQGQILPEILRSLNLKKDHTDRYIQWPIKRFLHIGHLINSKVGNLTFIIFHDSYRSALYAYPSTSVDIIHGVFSNFTHFTFSKPSSNDISITDILAFLENTSTVIDLYHLFPGKPESWIISSQ